MRLIWASLKKVDVSFPMTLVLFITSLIGQSGRHTCSTYNTHAVHPLGVYTCVGSFLISSSYFMWMCIQTLSWYLCERTDRHSIDRADCIRDEIRVMLQFAHCDLIILICLSDFSAAERQLDLVTRSRPPATHTVPRSQIDTQSWCRHRKDKFIQKNSVFLFTSSKWKQ